MSRILNQVRRQIEASGQSRYAIWQATGINQSQLSRLMSGQAGVRYETLEQLIDYLELEIVIRPKRRRKGK
jgi:DNA-binding Xre family transcriptional regulator